MCVCLCMHARAYMYYVHYTLFNIRYVLRLNKNSNLKQDTKDKMYLFQEVDTDTEVPADI